MLEKYSAECLLGYFHINCGNKELNMLKTGY
jgi:hypothetical protein